MTRQRHTQRETRKHHGNNAGAACQVEKVDHATALQMTKTLGSIKQVGTSLGSFSLTAALLSALLTEFSSELDRKEGQLDSDPHWWMPMTCDLGVPACCGVFTSFKRLVSNTR